MIGRADDGARGMRSHLLEGKVRHRRARPFTYELEHDVYYFALDLARARRGDAPAPARRAATAANVVAFRDADHLARPVAGSAGRASATTSARRGSTRRAGQITLVTSLRVLGYVFNPASFYLCRDERGTLRRGGRRGA